MARVTRAVAAGAALLLAGCVLPARTAGQYRDDAGAAVQSARSEVGTVVLVLEQLDAGRVTGQTADVLVTDAEEALGPVQDSFGSVQPPSPALDGVRDEVTGLLGDAEDAVAAARLAVRRDDPAGRHTAADDLREVARRLDRLARVLS